MGQCRTCGKTIHYEPGRGTPEAQALFILCRKCARQRVKGRAERFALAHSRAYDAAYKRLVRSGQALLQGVQVP